MTFATNTSDKQLPSFATVPGTGHPGVAALDRRRFLSLAVGTAAALGLAACTRSDASGTGDAVSKAPLGTAVPAGTQLRIASSLGAIQLGVQLAGLTPKLAFTVPEWPNIGAGPDVINAFRAKSLDVGVNAGIPPIQAHFQQLPAKIVAINQVRRPSYVFATKPGSDITTVKDFAGKQLAFSQGQAQGVVLLRALDGAGLKPTDVKLVPLTSNQFLTALQSGQVDAAPLGLAQVPPYIDQYSKDGAKIVETDVVDFLTVLWAPAEVLNDEAKSAALASFVPLWAQSLVWVYEHPQDWIDKYYVATQNITADAAKKIIALGSRPEFPPTWDEAIAWEQKTVDLLAGGGFVEKFDANEVFDRRFEALASQGVSDDYRKAKP
jgi:sulfonate transport system substrate-binding protein